MKNFFVDRQDGLDIDDAVRCVSAHFVDQIPVKADHGVVITEDAVGSKHDVDLSGSGFCECLHRRKGFLSVLDGRF